MPDWPTDGAGTHLTRLPSRGRGVNGRHRRTAIAAAAPREHAELWRPLPVHDPLKLLAFEAGCEAYCEREVDEVK
jgi:hypothetical protein